MEATVLDNVSINPWISGTIGRTGMSGYTEEGDLSGEVRRTGYTQAEMRLGLTAVAELSAQTSLSGTLEVAHRLGTAPAAKGQVVGRFDFGLGGGTQGSSWARARLDLDHQIAESIRFSGSLYAATQGQDAAFRVRWG